MTTKTTFTSPDGTQTLTIACHEGKSGFNVHVTHRIGDNRGVTGCRSNHQDKADAVKATESLKAEAAKRGWTEKAAIVKNAFTSLPTAPTDGVAAPKAPKAKKTSKQ